MGNISFLNVGCGDSTIIDYGYEKIIIDCYNIENYRNKLPHNKKIHALFITHQHHDHFDGMDYLLQNGFDIKYIITSPYSRRYGDNSVDVDEWNSFNQYIDSFKNRGSKVYKPYRQNDFSEPWWQPFGFKIWMIGPNKEIANSDTRELHDACLVFLLDMGERQCLFAGDASDKSLSYIEKNTNNFCNDILHASHHGSIEGADLDFIKKCNAKYTVISTKSGVYPSVPDNTALKRYRDNTKYEVYRTDINDTISINI